LVVVNYLNYPDTINYVQKYLLGQREIDLEIAVIDNASPNESFKVLKDTFVGYDSIKILRNHSNNGYAAGNNIGIRYLEQKKCDYILISNNDIEIDDNFLLIKMVRIYNTLESAAFISPVMIINKNISREFSAWKLPVKLKEVLSSTFLVKILTQPYHNRFLYKIPAGKDKYLKVDCLAGSFFMGATEIFRRINYLDENTFLYYEETILGLKIKQINLYNYLIGDLEYKHLHAQTMKMVYSPYRKYKMLLDSKLYYWKTYHKAGNLFIVTMKFLFLILAAELFLISLFNKTETGNK